MTILVTDATGFVGSAVRGGCCPAICRYACSTIVICPSPGISWTRNHDAACYFAISYWGKKFKGEPVVLKRTIERRSNRSSEAASAKSGGVVSKSEIVGACMTCRSAHC